MDRQEIKDASLRLFGEPNGCPIQRSDCAFCEASREMQEAHDRDDKGLLQLWANRRVEFLSEMSRLGWLDKENYDEQERLMRTVMNGNRMYGCPFLTPSCPFCTIMPVEISRGVLERTRWIDLISRVMAVYPLPTDIKERRDVINKLYSEYPNKS